MIPLSTLMTITEVPSTEITTRFNLFRALEISGIPARLHLRSGPGGPRGRLREDDAEGDGLRLLRALLPGEGGATAATFILAIVFVSSAGRDVRAGACRAVLLGSPLVALGPLFGVRPARRNDVYVQSAHHAHRARSEERDPDRRGRKGGRTRGAAGRRSGAGGGAARLPAHPDDDFAFILGMVPLMLASGAVPGRERHGHAIFWAICRHVPRRVHRSGHLRLRGAAGRRHRRAKPPPAAAPEPPAALREEHREALEPPPGRRHFGSSLRPPLGPDYPTQRGVTAQRYPAASFPPRRARAGFAHRPRPRRRSSRVQCPAGADSDRA